MNLFNPKTLIKLVAKTLKKMRIFALGILDENNSIEGIFIASQKSARWQPGKGRNALPFDRPTVIFMTVVSAVDRPVDRAKTIGRPPGRPGPTREWGAFSRSTARSTGRIS